MTATTLDPSRIMAVGMGFWAAKTLQSAVELELFTTLATKSLTGPEVGQRLGLHPRAINDFLDALVALGFLDRDGDGPDGRYRNNRETAAFLDKTSPAYIGAVLEMCSTRHYRFWADLTEALRTGQPQSEAKHSGKPMFDMLYQDAGKVGVFLDAMQALQAANFHALGEKFDFTGHQTLCDVGGGSAQLCRILAERHPHLECASFDLPVVTQIAEKAIAAAGLTGRVHAMSGDFFTDPLPRADVITMGNVLHDWNLDKKQHLIKAAYNALPDNGVLIIIENLIDDARRHNSFGLLMSLNMLINFGDAFDFTGADLTHWCHEIGFHEVTIQPLTTTASAGIARK